MGEPAAVIDTAPLIVLLGGRIDRLGRQARRVLRRAGLGRLRIAVPTVCLFEVSQLEERGRITLGVSFDRWCDLVEEAPALVVVPLQRGHVSGARALPALRDPFDRLVAGTALALGLPLITPDRGIASSGRLQVIW